MKPVQKIREDGKCRRAGCNGTVEVTKDDGQLTSRCVNCGDRVYLPNSWPSDARKIAPVSRKTGSVQNEPRPTPQIPASALDKVGSSKNVGRGPRRTTLQAELDWFQWEFLRRSPEYQAEWTRLQTKYATKPKGTLKVQQWVQACIDRGEFAFREHEEAVIARRFGLYDLHPPSKRFPLNAPPQFERRPPVQAAFGSLLDLYRDPARPQSARLRDGCAVVIIDLKATDEDLAAGVKQAAHILRLPKEKLRDSAWSEWLLSDEVIVERRPNKVSRMQKYLDAWDFDKRLQSTIKDRSRRLSSVARRLGLTAEFADELVEDYLGKARKLIRAAASGNFPGD